MERTIGKVATVGFGLALVVLAANAWVSYHNTRQLVENDQWVDHTHRVLLQLESLLTSMTDAEAGQRGYLLTGEARYLAPYEAATARIEEQLRQLEQLSADNTRQQERLATLRAKIDTRFKLFSENIALRKAGGPGPAWRPVLEQEKRVMDEIREVVAGMKAKESELLERREEASKAGLHKALVTFAIATVVAMGLVVLAYVLLHRDLAARKRLAAERELLARYNRLLLESTGEGIYGIDLKGNCTLLNRAGARMLRLQAEDALGKPMHALTHHHHADGSPYAVDQCPITSVLRSGQGGRVDDEVFWRPDKSSFPVEYSAFPMVSKGVVEGAVVTFSDITARKRADEEVKEAKNAAEAANVTKSQFLANMSHELRTPLNAVILYSELLQEEAEDRGVAEFVPDLEKIRAAGKHLLALINGVLDLSKIEAGKMELYLETFDIATLVQEVAATLQPLVQKNTNQLDLRLPPALGCMQADVTKVRQILFNLVSNACKFTEKGLVTIDVTRQQEQGRDTVTLCVTDSGIGMTSAQVAKLFQPFTQADASTTRKYGGTGLGLAISKRFCELMGGDITVTSEPGKGSVFTVRLPAHLTAPAEPTPAPAATGRGPAGPAIVLVIDDDPAVRDLMARFVAKEGIRAATAADGEEGLRLARQLRPKVIFLDVIMPRMDGWAVLSALKADPQLANIPVVMLTMMNEPEMGYMLGAADYVTKPIDRNQLAAVLKKYRPVSPASHVLVVEDDDATRHVLRRTLAKQGWTVAEAANGRAALERVAETRPELILLDLMMPEMDGFEFLAELRKNEVGQSIPVVVLTSKDLSPQERLRLNGNVEKILQKGAFSRDALLREVRKVVAQCVARPAMADGVPEAGKNGHPGTETRAAEIPAAAGR